MPMGMVAFFSWLAGLAPHVIHRRPPAAGRAIQSAAERAKRTTVTPARAWRTEGMTSTQSS